MTKIQTTIRMQSAEGWRIRQAALKNKTAECLTIAILPCHTFYMGRAQQAQTAKKGRDH